MCEREYVPRSLIQELFSGLAERSSHRHGAAQLRGRHGPLRPRGDQVGEPAPLLGHLIHHEPGIESAKFEHMTPETPLHNSSFFHFFLLEFHNRISFVFDTCSQFVLSHPSTSSLAPTSGPRSCSTSTRRCPTLSLLAPSSRTASSRRSRCRTFPRCLC